MGRALTKFLDVVRAVGVLLLALCAALPARADLELGIYSAITTRFGPMQVIAAPGGMKGLAFNSVPLAGIQDRFIEIRGGFGVEGAGVDWVLVSTAHGGNMCPYALIILQVSQQGIRQTAPIGECLGDVQRAEITERSIIVELGDPDIFVAHRRFEFDGAQLTEAAVPLQLQPAPGAGAAVTRWVGKPSYEPFRDPAELARFSALIAPEQLRKLAGAMGLPNAVERQGNWVFGTGCQPHACNAVAGMWGMRISDGAVIARLIDRSGAIQNFGDQIAQADQEVVNATSVFISRFFNSR